MLLPRTMGQYTVRSLPDSAVTVEKDVVTLPVSPDQVIEMPWVSSNIEHTADYTTPRVSPSRVCKGTERRLTFSHQSRTTRSSRSTKLARSWNPAERETVRTTESNGTSTSLKKLFMDGPWSYALALSGGTGPADVDTK